MSGEDELVSATQVELQDWGSVGAAEQKTAASPSAPVRVSPPAHAVASLCPHVVEDLTLRPAAEADVVDVDMNYFVLGLTDIVKGGDQGIAPTAEARVDELLRRPLTADGAVQVALLKNRGLQAAFNDLGVSEAQYVLRLLSTQFAAASVAVPK